MAILGTDPTQATLSPDEIRRRQLMQQLGGGAAPAQAPSNQQLPAPTATPPSQDSSGANTTTPPPAEPLSQSPQEQYAAQRSQFETAHPEAAGKPPVGPFIKPDTSGEPSFQQPSLRNRLLHGLFYGMEEFGRPGQGIKSEQEWEQEQAKEREAVRNWPMQRQQNVETAFGKELGGQQELAKTQQAQATAAEQNFNTENPTLELQLAEANRTGNTRQAEVTLDMIAREAAAKNPWMKMAPPDMKETMMAGINDPAMHNPDGSWNMAEVERQTIARKQAPKNIEENLKQSIVDAQNKGDQAGAAKLQQQLRDLNPQAEAAFAAANEERKIREQGEQLKATQAQQAENATADQAHQALYAQQNYKDRMEDWYKSGHFAKDSGLIAEQLKGQGPEGARLGPFAGILTATPLGAVGALGAEGILNAASGSINGYLDTLKKAGISPEGYQVMQAYTDALLGRMQYEMGTMGIKASAMRSRALVEKAMMTVPPPNVGQEKFEGAFQQYYHPMENSTGRRKFSTSPDYQPPTFEESYGRPRNAAAPNQPASDVWQPPAGAQPPAAPKEDNKYLTMDGKHVAISKGGQWHNLPSQ